MGVSLLGNGAFSNLLFNMNAALYPAVVALIQILFISQKKILSRTSKYVFRTLLATEHTTLTLLADYTTTC